MSFTISAFNHAEWERHGLADYSDFAGMISECNVGEDSFSGFGEWFFVPDEPLPNGDRVIYFGSWGNDNSPGASMYTHAEIFGMTDADHEAASLSGFGTGGRSPSTFALSQPPGHLGLEENGPPCPTVPPDFNVTNVSTTRLPRRF